MGFLDARGANVGIDEELVVDGSNEEKSGDNVGVSEELVENG